MISAREIQKKIEYDPVIPAIKDDRALNKALESKNAVLFMLYGDLLSIEEQVRRIHKAGKIAVYHVDLIQGLTSHTGVVDYLKERIGADGIISTKSSVIEYAAMLNYFCVMRFFILDSLSLANLKRTVSRTPANMIEILPGAMPKVLTSLCRSTDKAIIAGGLIEDRDDAVAALRAGAVAISTSSQELWRKAHT